MHDHKGQFHEFAIQSVLFRGRADWYFCYLKAERISQVLVALAATAPQQDLSRLTQQAEEVPALVLRLAARSAAMAEVLASILTTMSLLRTEGVRGTIRKENVALILTEYELIAQKLAGDSHPSPFLVSTDLVAGGLAVPGDYSRVTLGTMPKDAPITATPPARPARPTPRTAPEKTDIGMSDTPVGASAASRTKKILELVATSSGVSVKDLSQVVPGVSEKTIQRELSALIESGQIRKEGERRWSLYYPSL